MNEGRNEKAEAADCAICWPRHDPCCHRSELVQCAWTRSAHGITTRILAKRVFHRETHTPSRADGPPVNVQHSSNQHTNIHQTQDSHLSKWKTGHIVRRCRSCQLPTESRRDTVASQGGLFFVTQSVWSFKSLSMCQAGTGIFRPHTGPQFAQPLTYPLNKPLSRPIFFLVTIFTMQGCFLHRACTLLPTLRSCSPTAGYRLHPRCPGTATPSSSPISGQKYPVA